MPGTHYGPHPGQPRYVVGYDGSSEARVALEIAAHEAGPTGHVWVVLAGTPEDVADDLHELRDGAIPALLTTRWSAEPIDELPAAGILSVAQRHDATEILIGSRGRGRAAALLGSVAHDVLHRADRPVRVITRSAAVRIARAPTPLP